MGLIDASASGQFKIGDTTINRLGYGAMRLTGPGIWGAPSDRGAALATLRRLHEIGVNFIDTADSYGPDVSEELIREALHPYEGLLIATKAGLTRPGPDQWIPNGRPVSDCTGQRQPQEARRRADRSLAAPSNRSASTARRTVRRPAPTARRRHHSPCGAERGLGGRHRSRSAGISGGDGAEPLQPRGPRQ